MKIHHFTCAAALFASVGAAHAGSDAGVLLEANFNSEPIDQQIATGGPELGEPVSVDANLSAIVRAAPLPTPSLELSQTISGSAHVAAFEFLGDEEVTHGDLNVHMRIQAAQFDVLEIYVRERSGAAQDFLTLTFSSFGDILASDKNGEVGPIGPYAINVVQVLALHFHMDEGTYDVDLDGVPLISARAHGVTARGIGRIMVGAGTLTTSGALFYFDRLRVTRGDGIFGNGFD
jgi:hypothetical protein